VQWWREAVVYQVYVRSFSDSDGDGIGDLDGVRARLGYLELLGVDALWLTPISASPMADHGYDVADPRAVDPLFGDLDAFDALVEAAHEHGLRIVVALVPNHTSVEHPWFRAARAAAPKSPERSRYHFRVGRGEDGAEPPTDWTSVFGGPAWTRLPDGEWYLHLFAADQPDLNWDHPEVWADLETTLRFWLDHGADGVRIAVADGMSKPKGLPDAAVARTLDPRFDDDGVHEVHRRIRAVLDEYTDRVAVGDVPVPDEERFARYLRPDELHLAFDVRLMRAPFDAAAVRDAVQHTMAALESVGAVPTWAIAGHDISRPATRYGRPGTDRARAMALVTIALPGCVVLYNGDELGLPDTPVPDDALQDPVWEHSGHTVRGRDAFRVPLPWEGGPPGYGFTTGVPWLPMPPDYETVTVAEQLEDTGSTLSLVRRALDLRRSHAGFSGTELEWFGAPDGCLAFRRSGTTLVCALNTSDDSVVLPPGDLLLSSGPLDDGMLPPDTAVWLA
jgi:alpha-glucosidase